MHHFCHSVNYPSDDIDILAGWINSGRNSLAVSPVILLPRLNRAIVTEPQHFSTAAASCSALSRDNGEHGHTGVRMCPALSARPGSSQPAEWAAERLRRLTGTQVVPRRQTGHLQPALYTHHWALTDWQALTERFVRHSERIKKLKNRGVCACMFVCTYLWMCDECCLAIRRGFRGRKLCNNLARGPPRLLCTQCFPPNQPPC